MREFIARMPKAELHLHIEGSFEPELIFEIADRNKIPLRYKNVEELRKAYEFRNLQEFLDIYYTGMNVLRTEKDYYDLTWKYLEKIRSQNVIHTEIFFDPQAHTERGIPFETVFHGIYNALKDAEKKFGISFNIIMSFLRHLDEKSAFETLRQALPYKEYIVGIGLDSSEIGNPPSKFRNVFTEAKKHGFKLTAHAGEEGPPEYIKEALDLLNVDRIDHGNRVLENENLVQRLVEEEITLTLCPLSNRKLQVISDMKEHPVKIMLEKGLKATVNSDDPAYFGGYMNENFFAVTESLNLKKEHLYTLVKNSFEEAFVSEERRKEMLARLDSYFA